MKGTIGWAIGWAIGIGCVLMIGYIAFDITVSIWTAWHADEASITEGNIWAGGIFAFIAIALTLGLLTHLVDKRQQRSRAEQEERKEREREERNRWFRSRLRIEKKFERLGLSREDIQALMEEE